VVKTGLNQIVKKYRSPIASAIAKPIAEAIGLLLVFYLVAFLLQNFSFAWQAKPALQLNFFVLFVRLWKN
jgi:hypothetical protein